jgi:hypothetical protein
MTRIFIFGMPRILNNQRRLSNALCINYLRLAARKRVASLCTIAEDFVGAHDETSSIVTMRVKNPDRAPFEIESRDPT